ncbi:MAG: hypothetical protein ACOX9C_03115 [Kiritimatiellia bacterium]|jgi:tetratricopeptide (TPR) repeat protein
MRRIVCTWVLLFLLASCSGLAGGLEACNVPASESQLAEALSLFAQGLFFLDESHAPTGAATAVSYFRQAAAIDPASAEINEKLVLTLLMLGDFSGALEAQLAFVPHSSDLSKTWFRVSRVAMEAGAADTFAESIAARRALLPSADTQAGRRARTFLDADEVLGWAVLGRGNDSLRAFERVVDARADALRSGHAHERQDVSALLVHLSETRAAIKMRSGILAFVDKLAAVVDDDAYLADVCYEVACALLRKKGADPATITKLFERTLLSDTSRYEAVVGMVFPSPSMLRGLDAAAIAEHIGQHPRPEAIEFPFAMVRLGYLLEAEDVPAAVAEHGKIKAMLATGQGGATDSANRYAMSSATLDLAGDREAAVALLIEGLAVHPDSATLKNSLAYTLALLERDLDKALELIDDALQVEPENSAYLDTLGWVLCKRGDYMGALRSLLRAIEHQQKPNYEIYDHVGDVLVKLGRGAEAPAWWAKSYRILPTDAVAEKLREAGLDPEALRAP